MSDLPTFQYPGARVQPTASPVGSLLDNVNALAQGYQTGMQVPTVAGAIAGGITQAVDTYSKLALQQAQTDALKAETAYHNAQASSLLDGSQALKEQADLDYKKAETAKITSENKNQTDFQTAITKLGSAPPGDLPGLFNDPSITGPLARNWKEGGSVQAGMAFSRSGNDPSIGNTIDGIKRATFEGAQNDVIQKINNSLVTQGMNSLAQGTTTGLWNRLGAKVDPNLNTLQVVQRLEPFPHGQKTFNPSTGEMEGNIPDGTPGKEDAGKWDLYDPVSKKLVDTLDDAKNNKEATTFLNTKKGLTLHFDNQAQVIGLSSTPNNISLTAQGTQMQPQVTSQTAPPSTSTDTQNINPNIVPPQAGLSTTQSAILQKQAQWAAQARSLSGGKLPSPTLAPSIQTPQSTQTPAPTITSVPTAQDNISKITGSAASLTITPTPTVKPVLYHAINSNPYLQNASALIKGFASQESAGDINAVSSTGVKGLLQVTKATAADYGFDRDDPAQQVPAASAFIADMYEGTNYYKNSPLNGNLQLVAAAYNVGPGIITHAIKETGSTNWPTIRDYLSTTLSPFKFKQVKDYPERVLNASAQFANPTNRADQTLISNFSMNGLIA